jgi:hypothetical protein
MFIISHVGLVILAWVIPRALANGVLYTRSGGTILRSENPVIFWATFSALLVVAAMLLALAVGTDWILWLKWNDH